MITVLLQECGFFNFSFLSYIYIGDIKRDITRDVVRLIYLPWPIETIITVSHRPRWPRQVQSGVAVADGFTNQCRQCKWSFNVKSHSIQSCSDAQTSLASIDICEWCWKIYYYQTPIHMLVGCQEFVFV